MSNISPLEQGWTIASLRSLTWQIMNNKLPHFALSRQNGEKSNHETWDQLNNGINKDRLSNEKREEDDNEWFNRHEQ